MLDFGSKTALEVLCSEMVIGSGARGKGLRLGVIRDVLDEVITTAKVLKKRRMSRGGRQEEKTCSGDVCGEGGDVALLGRAI